MITPPDEGSDAMFARMTGRSPRRPPLPSDMADSASTLSLNARGPEGSRSARRLRRAGSVPGVLYGGGDAPAHFSVDARTLRNTLAHSGAILQVSLDGGKESPVLVKDVQRHPVRGEVVHVDLLRVRMDETIHTTVVLDLTGADHAPGVVQGGVLSQETREVNIEAFPGDIPDVITHDVSGLEMNATLLLSAVTAPRGVRFLDDPEETVVATITPPTLEPVDEEIETETALVGEDADVAEAKAEGDTADEAEQSAADS
jgi:large subunit ribosomal protein L25